VGPGLSLQSTLGGGFDKLSQLRQAQPPPGVGFPLLSLTQCSNPGKKKSGSRPDFFANKQMDYL